MTPEGARVTYTPVADVPRDGRGRRLWVGEWDTAAPPYCSNCGGNVTITDGGIVCTGYPGATPPRPGCGPCGPTMRRAQNCRLSDEEAARLNRGAAR